MASASSGRPEIAVCTYKTRPGQEQAFLALLQRHWPTLHRLGLVTDEPPLQLRGLPGKPGEAHVAGPSTFIEIFTWKDGEAAGVAHDTPEVMQIWEPMDALCESMEFPHFERI